MKTMLLKAVPIWLLILSFAGGAQAQFENVYIGVNGLTCSQCSRTVEMSIRKLSFVADVKMNLEHTEGTIVLKKNSKADMEKIAQAVMNAGFSVRYLQADLHIDNSAVSSGACLTYNGDQFVFAEAPKAPLAGTIKLKFIGKKYMPKSDFKKVEAHMSDKCGNATGKVYHVSM